MNTTFPTASKQSIFRVFKAKKKNLPASPLRFLKSIHKGIPVFKPKNID